MSRGQEAGQYFERGCLADPVPAHETHNLSRIDRKGHISKNVAFTVVGVDFIKLQHGIREA